MWKTLITILCASGTVLAYHEPQSVLVPASVKNRTRIEKQNRILRQFTCPDGFVRLKKNCFYFSAGIANWQEAHFFCFDRNATLATLPKRHMDRRLRKFLAGPQMKQLERWIGARYNWPNSTWEWAITAQKITYNGFSKSNSGSDQLYRWNCAVMNPERKFHWEARDCIEQKHYICHVPAAKIDCNDIKFRCPITASQSEKGRRKLPGRRRKHRIKSNRNGTLTENVLNKNEIVPVRQGRWRTTRKSPPMWGNGMRPGMRPPPVSDSTRWAKYSDRLQPVKGKGPTDPDRWVSPSKLPTTSDNLHLDTEPGKESLRISLGSPRSGLKTLSAETDNTLDQINLFKTFDGETLLKT